MDIAKYPRTRHLEGSRLQAGDLGDDDRAGNLLLQSRGHYLAGGWRERHFALLKTWANAQAHLLRPVLGSRYVMYGEWLYAKHTVFYDRLPHYFLEFDVLDRERGIFLSTEARRELLFGLPVMPVPVLHRGGIDTPDALRRLIRPSLYKSAD